MIDVSKLQQGDKITVPTDLGIDREVVVHHTFEADDIHYVVAAWRNHFGQPFFAVYDGYQIRSVVNVPLR